MAAIRYGLIALALLAATVFLPRPSGGDCSRWRGTACRLSPVQVRNFTSATSSGRSRHGRLLQRLSPAIGIEHPRPVVGTGAVQRDPCRICTRAALSKR